MKLRIQGDSIRLRLTRPEVERLAQDGRVADTVHLAPGVTFVYRLETADVSTPHASLLAHALTVALPPSWVDGWPDDERVGFEATQDAGDGRTLSLLIEKDFQCLHREAEEPDNYANPHADAEPKESA